MTSLHDLTATTPGLPCRTTDPELWFSRNSSERALAVALCQECPLRRPCAQYAIDNQVQGVWGGSAVSPMVRARLRGRPWRFDEEGRVRMLCGSDEAYRSHLGYREEPCEACTAAHVVVIEAGRRDRLAAEHARGGSTTGYHLHRRIGEPACALCLGRMREESTASRLRKASRRLQRPRVASVTSGASEPVRGAPAGAQSLAAA